MSWQLFKHNPWTGWTIATDRFADHYKPNFGIVQKDVSPWMKGQVKSRSSFLLYNH